MPSPHNFFPPNQLASSRYDTVIRGLENSYKMATPKPPFHLGNFLKSIPGIKLPVGAGTGIGALVGIALEFAFPPPTADEDAILERIRNKEQEIQSATYPFRGGQMDGVSYKITYTYSIGSPSATATKWSLNCWGPIRSIEPLWESNDGYSFAGGLKINCRGIQNSNINSCSGVSASPVESFPSSQGPRIFIRECIGNPSNKAPRTITILSVERNSGGADTGGDPPAILQPIYSPPGTYSYDIDTLNREVGQVEHPPNEPYRVQFQTPLDIFFPPAISTPEIPSDFQIDIGVDLPGLLLPLEPPIQPQPQGGIEVNTGTTSPPLLYAPVPDRPTDPQFEIPYEMRQRLNTNPVPLRTQFNQPVTNPPTPDYVISNQTAIQPITLNPIPKIITPPTLPTEKPPEKPPEELIKENADRATEIATGIALLTPIIQGIASNTTSESITNAAAAGTCRTTQPGGCTSNLINDAVGNINKNTNDKVDALDAANALANAEQLKQLGIINNKLGEQIPNGGIGAKLSRFINWSVGDRVVGMMSMIASVHNAFMLSNNVGQTLFSILDNLGNIGSLILKPDGDANINSGEWVTSNLDSLFSTMLGAEVWTSVKASYKAANNIFSTSSNMYDNLRSIHNDSQELLNMVRRDTAELGNALVEEGVISEDNWDIRDPKVKIKSKSLVRLQRMNEGLEALDNKLEAIEQMTSTLLSIAQTAKEVKDNVDTLNTQLGDASKAFKSTRDEAIKALPDFDFGIDDLY